MLYNSTVEAERSLLWRARGALEDAARQPVREIGPSEADRGVDAFFEVNGTRLVVEAKVNPRSAGVAQGIAGLLAYREVVPDATLLLVVPLMGDAGQELCDRAGVNWIDAAGNAEIHTTGLHIVIRGRKLENRESFLPGETTINPFGRKAAGLVHALLRDLHRRWTRSELHVSTGLDQGYVSKIVTQLISSGLAREAASGITRTIEVIDPALLLDTWSERYVRPNIAFYGVIAARDGFAAAEKLGEILNEGSVPFALTGLAAAAHYTDFGSYRRVEAYVTGWLPQVALRRLNANGNARGHNIVLYADETSSTTGLRTANGTSYASPIITYLDLANAPERAEEARAEMRRYIEKSWA